MDFKRNNIYSKKHNYKYLIGEFIPTKKKYCCFKFFSEKGFNLMNKNHKDYSNIKKNLKLGKNKIYFAPLNKIILPNIEVYGKN